MLSIPTEFIVEVTDPQELSPETLVGGQRIYSYFRTHFMELRSERRVLPYIILHHQEQNSKLYNKNQHILQLKHADFHNFETPTGGLRIFHVTQMNGIQIAKTLRMFERHGFFMPHDIR